MVNNAFAQMDLFTYFSSQKITHLPGEFLSEKDVGEELSFEELSKKKGMLWLLTSAATYTGF